ncbi:MAG: serpin family protein [Lachnospiraceae bacterium]|nr:serpin family protein [Lachnospiraceae bacterium]
MKKLISTLLMITIIASGCTASTPADNSAPPEQQEVITSENPSETDLITDDVIKNTVTGKTQDEAFVYSMADFSFELFKKSITDKENSLVSPLSVMLALAMTANGADGETLAQMETLLGGGISLNDLNEYLYSYVKGLPSAENSQLLIANSIWFRDDEGRLTVEPDFLQTNADYYNAALFKAAFDDQTVIDINEWVSQNTDGMIDKLLDQIDDEKMLYLINAVMFDAEWVKKYDSEWDVRDGEFTNIDGNTQSASFMRSRENTFIDDGMAKGFVKPYLGGYSFVALLPNEGVSIESYIESMSGAGFIENLRKARAGFGDIETFLPKFEYEYQLIMNDTLAGLGMPDAFNEMTADFRRMGSSPAGPLYIGEVVHKTFISVNESGTRAGAVTSVSIEAQSMPATLRFDRPFVYAIIDDVTNLPIFIGTLVKV